MKLLISFFIIAFISLPIILAIPPIANEFYGSIIDKGQPVGSGQVEARTAAGIYCGNFNIVNSGYYGLLSCIGDDPDTTQVEGAVSGGGVNFYLNGQLLFVMSGSPHWSSAAFTRIDLSVLAHCGDYYCDALQGETCSNCLFDCGLCGGGTINVSQNVTPGGGGGAVGGGGGLGAIGPGAAFGIVPKCDEYWRCADWKPKSCPINETQTRKCIDLNNCGTEKNKPNETRNCKYMAKCDDFVLNGNETDIDCGGGFCAKCELGKKCRIDSDCLSDACDPYRFICITPTFPKIPEIVVPRAPKVFAPGIIPCGKEFPWLLFLVLLLVAFIVMAISELYTWYLRYYDVKHKRLSRVAQLKKEILIRRRAFWITIAIITADIFLSLYLYINNGCPQYSTLTAFFIVVATLVSFVILYRLSRRFEYEESRSHKLLLRMLQRHQTGMTRLLHIENNQLAIFEETILALMETTRESIKDMKDLKQIYERLEPVEEKLLEIVDARIHKQPFDKLQTEISERIEELTKDDKFEASLAASASLLNIYNKLKILRDRYIKRDQVSEDLERTITSLSSDELKEEK